MATTFTPSRYKLRPTVRAPSPCSHRYTRLLSGSEKSRKLRSEPVTHVAALAAPSSRSSTATASPAATSFALERPTVAPPTSSKWPLKFDRDMKKEMTTAAFACMRTLLKIILSFFAKVSAEWRPTSIV